MLTSSAFFTMKKDDSRFPSCGTIKKGDFFMIVKVGVIGIGTVSQLMHLPILSGLHEQCQITAVSDISPTQLAFIAKKYNATPYPDPYELVKDPNVDAVFVCSPDQYHAAYALAAMEAGKHVFVEKPVTLCMEDLEKLIAAEKAHPELVCMVGYMRRYGNGFLKYPDFADVKSLEGVADTKHKAVPTFALPTTAGTAAEVTINYVIIDEDARKKMVCVDPNDIPAVAIVDPELMYSMPKGLTAATGMDALTHAIESYITPGAWAMSDMFELKAIEMIAQNLKAAVDNGKDVVAREAMSQAQYIAGMGFSNVGLGIVHSMAHPLGAFYDTPHGVANALLLPYVMEYNAESPAAPKYINIAKAMGVETAGMSEAEGVKAAIEAVKSLSLSIGIPQKLHEINVKEEDIPALAVAAFNDVCTGGNPRPTSVEDIEVLYRKAF